MTYLIALAVLIIDQYTKALAVSKLKAASVPVINDFFHLTYVENTGAAFGMFKNGNMVFILLTSIILLGIIVAFAVVRPREKLVKISAGLIMGGAAGNIADRIFRGFVVDFLDFRAISFPVFNVADSCVVIGAVLICAYLIFFDKKEAAKC